MILTRACVVLSFLIFGLQAWGSLEAVDRSARREPHERYTEYKKKSQDVAIKFWGQFSDSVLSYARPIESVDWGQIVQWPADLHLQQEFNFLRDQRWLPSPDGRNFLRRPSWLYPDDGCFARAAMVNLLAAKRELPLPSKVFVFGDLLVKTANHPEGIVTWWFHVASAVQINGEVQILDPALEPKRSMHTSEWILKMTDSLDHVEIAICNSGAYLPHDFCLEDSDRRESRGLYDQDNYLDFEWFRLKELNRNPHRELGEFPPWRDQGFNLEAKD